MKFANYIDKYIQEHGIGSELNLIFDFDEKIARALIDWPAVQRQRYEGLKATLPGIVAEDSSFSSSSRVEQAIWKYGRQYYDELMKMEEEAELSNCDGFDPNTEIISFIQENSDTTGEGSQKFNFFVWSSNTSKSIENGLDEYGIKDKFAKIISKDAVLLRKPKPYGFLQIYDENTPLSNYIMIGNDRYSDGGAAENAGIDSYHVTFFEDKD
jgi:phosphoglycolate phosphatase-like HAD superfamily hydrolase